MIAILTPTVRLEGLELVDKALQRQSDKEFMWYICSPEAPNMKTTFVWVKDNPVKKGNVWTLNEAYNRLFDAARESTFISWQDHTFAKPDTVAKFKAHLKHEPETFVTAVGNKYQDDSWMVETWRDPRMRDDQGSFYQCYPNDIEWNLCAGPCQAIAEVGGFDEYMDKFFGLDAFSVMQRIEEMGGYDFKIDQSIKSYSTEHKRNVSWDRLNWMAEGRYDEYVAARKKADMWPIL